MLIGRKASTEEECTGRKDVPTKIVARSVKFKYNWKSRHIFSVNNFGSCGLKLISNVRIKWAEVETISPEVTPAFLKAVLADPWHSPNLANGWNSVF